MLLHRCVDGHSSVDCEAVVIIIHHNYDEPIIVGLPQQLFIYRIDTLLNLVYPKNI